MESLVISPSILARCKFPPKNWIPPKEFLWKKFKQDIDYRKHSKHRAVHLEGAENQGNFSGTDQPDDDVKLTM